MDLIVESFWPTFTVKQHIWYCLSLQFSNSFYPVCFPVLCVHYIFSMAGSSGNPTPNPDYKAVFFTLSSCHFQLYCLHDKNALFHLVLSTSFTFSGFTFFYGLPVEIHWIKNTPRVSSSSFCLNKDNALTLLHAGFYSTFLRLYNLIVYVYVGMITRKHLSSTLIPPTSSTCGRRRCFRTQRIRGKRKGSRRYKSVCKDSLHTILVKFFEILQACLTGVILS